MVITFLQLTDHFGDTIRVNVNLIVSYKAVGSFTEVVTVNNSINVVESVSVIDQFFSK